MPVETSWRYRRLRQVFVQMLRLKCQHAKYAVKVDSWSLLYAYLRWINHNTWWTAKNDNKWTKKGINELGILLKSSNFLYFLSCKQGYYVFALGDLALSSLLCGKPWMWADIRTIFVVATHAKYLEKILQRNCMYEHARTSLLSHKKLMA